MKTLVLWSLALLSLGACERSGDQTRSSSARYQPTEFIRSFDAGKLADANWKINSRSEEHRLYDGREGSFRKGKIVLVSSSPEFSSSVLKAAFRSAPDFRESGEIVLGQEYRCAYGDPARYTGLITARVLQSNNRVEVIYEIVEGPKSEQGIAPNDR